MFTLQQLGVLGVHVQLLHCGKTPFLVLPSTYKNKGQVNVLEMAEEMARNNIRIICMIPASDPRKRREYASSDPRRRRELF